MFDKLKVDLAARWLNQNKDAPALIMNASDKIYLALSQKTVGKLVYIYTLACLKTGNNQYNVIPTTEIATFESRKRANIYYNAVNQVMAYQQKSVGPSRIRKMFTDEIAKFYQNTR